MCLLILFVIQLTKVVLQPLAPPGFFPVAFWMIAAGRVVGHPGAVSWAPGENPWGQQGRSNSQFSVLLGDLRAVCAIVLIFRAVSCYWECEAFIWKAGAVATWAEPGTQGGALAGAADTLATGHPHHGLVGRAARDLTYVGGKTERVFKEVL